MPIATNSLIAAMSALAREIKRLNAQMEEGDEEDPELEPIGQEILDMTAALSELGGLYEEKRKDIPGLPPLDRLMLER